MKKTYTLELTAEELDSVAIGYPLCSKSPATVQKLAVAKLQAKADREANDLRLPWRAYYWSNTNGSGWSFGWQAPPTAGMPKGWPCSGRESYCTTEAMAKLMSAAPELLEAVKLCDTYFRLYESGLMGHGGCLDKIERALRKVASGIPESP